MKLKLWKKSERDRKAFVSLNDELWGVLSVKTLQSFLYPVPCELEIREDDAHILQKALRDAAWWEVTDYLARAEHSSHQCRALLARRFYHESIIRKCLELCSEKGYLDDSRFAEILIHSLVERGKSKRAIIAKLREQRLPSSLYEPLLEQLYDPKENASRLTEEISKLLFKYRELPKPSQKDKVFTSLYRKGFDLDDISAAWHQARKS